jgi:RNA polymerase sigma-70 factor (ECF subfamily)
VSDELSRNPAQSDDAAQVERMAAGRPEALAALYDRYAPALLGLALRMLADRRDAEDLVHDVFLEAWHKAHSYDPARGQVRSWLLVKLRSRALDRLRTLEVVHRHVQRLDGLDPDPGAQRELERFRGMARSRAIDAIAALPANQRVIVEMSSLQGYSCSEIAERCGLPVGTVRSRLSRALASLRRQLGDEGAR